MIQCLMIQTKDRKKFFTYEKNLPQLIEFSKIFNAEISTVQIPSEAEVLDLEELAPALCEKKSQDINYKVIEVKLKPKETRKLSILRASKVISYIKSSLLNGKIVSLKELNKKYKKHNLTIACFCNYFKKARAELAENGHQLVKVGGGKYKIA
jgi:hypothetical protein